MKTLEQRFFGKVEKTESCWNWTGGLTSGGYGKFSFNRKTISAHRMSWLIHFGEIPKGEGYHGTCVLHKCDNRKCINPKHLFLGTQKVNIIDSYNKGRKEGFLIGEKNVNSRLSSSEVKKMRGLHKNKKIQQNVLAEMFNVSQGTVSLIVNNKRYLNLRGI